MSDWLALEWSSAIVSSTITTILCIVFGTYYKAKIEKNIQHNLDRKLEVTRAELRREEEVLKSELRTKHEQSLTLINSALSGFSNRHAAIEKRRFEAIEKIWSSAVSKSGLKTMAKLATAIKMEVAIEVASKQDAEGELLRKFADAMWRTAGLDDIAPIEWADSERPFLSPLAWALFSAHQQVLTYPLGQWAAMRSGLGVSILADSKPILTLVKSALPNQTDFIDKFGIGGLTYLIEELEEALLAELQRNLHDPQADQARLKQAAAILKAVGNIAKAAEERIEIPPLIAR